MNIQIRRSLWEARRSGTVIRPISLLAFPFLSPPLHFSPPGAAACFQGLKITKGDGRPEWLIELGNQRWNQREGTIVPCTVFVWAGGTIKPPKSVQNTLVLYGTSYSSIGNTSPRSVKTEQLRFVRTMKLEMNNALKNYFSRGEPSGPSKPSKKA